MDIPGLSIFQGEGSLKLNTSANQLEEEEALEDQKRRNEELGNVLQNAFDDLIEDEDCTIDTSANLKSQYSDVDRSHCANAYRNNILANNYGSIRHEVDQGVHSARNDDRESLKYMEENEQLKQIINSKDNELHNISKMLQDERKRVEELSKRFAISEAEKSRSEMARQQTHELLVESKAQCSELEDSTNKLKTKFKTLEDANTKLQEDLERTRLMLSDVQQKYHMVEKNAGFNADRRVDILIKQTTDRHNAQIEILQQQLDILRNKLDDKDKEINALDIRYKELQRNRETMLIDKSQTINQLAKSLEESQQQCQKLMTKKDFAQENIALKRVINALEQQSEHQQKTINDLQTRLDNTTAELVLMDSVLQENMDCDSNNTRRFSFIKQNLAESTPLSSNDGLEKLKRELYRSVSNQKAKREEIKKLQNEIENKSSELKKTLADLDLRNKELKECQNELTFKNDEIKLLKEEENKCLVTIDTLKEEKIRLQNRIKVLENELEEAKRSKFNSSKISYLEAEYDKIKLEKQQLESEIEKLRRDFRRASKSPPESKENKFNQLDVQLKNLNIDLEELKQENESLKSNYESILKENEKLKEHKHLDPLRLELEKQKFLLKDAQNECDRIKNLYVEICNAKELITLELEQLKARDIYKELLSEKAQCFNLKTALQLAEMKSSEILKSLEIEKTNRENEVRSLKAKLTKEKCENSKNSSSPMNCTKCLHHTTELTKLEIANIKLENECSIHRKKLADLQDKLSQSQELISELNEKIGLKEDQENIIADLKEKAQKFEEYIETCRTTNTYNSSQQANSNSTSGISSPKATVRNQSAEASPEVQNKIRREIETSMRDEMAKIFAKELKTMEERFRMRLQELEDENNFLKKDLESIKNDLTERQNQIQLLKYTVIAEREKFNEISKMRDEQTAKKYTEILQKCREQLQAKQERIKELIRELDERNMQIENERQSMKAVMKQWEESRTLSENKEADMLKCINELTHEHAKMIESWKKKYESAKKTANNYKLYSEEKEQHIMKEYERMKTEFELAKTKLKNKFHDCLDQNIASKNIS